MLPDLATDAGPGHARVWAHLRACPACRREFAGFVEAARALRRLAESSVPDPEFFADLENTTMRAVALAPMPVTPRWRMMRRGLTVAAACTLCAVFGHWVATKREPPGSALLERAPLTSSAVRSVPASDGRLVPVGFTPSRQGLRGQQRLWREAWSELLPTAPSGR